jgi:hypothetical protein
MISSTILTLVVIPAIYSLWQEWALRREVEASVRPGAGLVPAPSELAPDGGGKS